MISALHLLFAGGKRGICDLRCVRMSEDQREGGMSMDATKENLAELLVCAEDYEIGVCEEYFCKDCKYSGTYCTYKAQADYLIANGVTVADGKDTDVTDNNVGHKWIPVTERLPDTEDRVLVCCKTKKGLQTINMAYLFNGTWHGQGSMSGVTHWMPLPEPPKGE